MFLEKQISILEWFLKDRVTLKTEIIATEIVLIYTIWNVESILIHVEIVIIICIIDLH